MLRVALTMKKFIIIFFFLFTALQLKCIASDEKLNTYIFDYLNYNELQTLLDENKIDSKLEAKVDKVLSTPIIDNTISKNFKPKEDPRIGKYIRVSSWNIARGTNIDKLKLIYSDENALLLNSMPQHLSEIRQQVKLFKESDIITLSEVDTGLYRTDYRNIVQELAQTGGYNYAYGVEFLEIDPCNLGINATEWSETFEKSCGIRPVAIDRALYRGLHGSAILSKYPIKNVRILRLPTVYDWYRGERIEISNLEKVRRHTAQKVLDEKILTEIRYGSRIALIADIEIPGGTPLTVVATHLENRTIPKGRLAQLNFILENIKDIKNPVVLIGDMNTMVGDGRPTSIKHEAKKYISDYQNWVKCGISLMTPVSWVVTPTQLTINFVRRNSDPTVADIPVVLPNPEHTFFTKLYNFRFDDGYCFDFRGEKNKSYKYYPGWLGNSSERRLKGYKPTYLFSRNGGILKFKLDWVFVKGELKNPEEKHGSEKFAPHFGRTLYELNYCLEKPLSDHAPITVQIPLENYKK